jgi:hypothetical protein
MRQNDLCSRDVIFSASLFIRRFHWIEVAVRMKKISSRCRDADAFAKMRNGRRLPGKAWLAIVVAAGRV